MAGFAQNEGVSNDNDNNELEEIESINPSADFEAVKSPIIVDEDPFGSQGIPIFANTDKNINTLRKSKRNDSGVFAHEDYDTWGAEYRLILNKVSLGSQALQNFVGLFELENPFGRIIPYEEVAAHLSIPMGRLNVAYLHSIKSKVLKTDIFWFFEGFEVRSFISQIEANNQPDDLSQAMALEGVVLTNPIIAEQLKDYKFYPWSPSILGAFPTKYPQLFDPITIELIGVGKLGNNKLVTLATRNCLLLYKLLIEKYPLPVSSFDLSKIMSTKDANRVTPSDNSFQSQKSKTIRELDKLIKKVSNGELGLEPTLELGSSRIEVRIVQTK